MLLKNPPARTGGLRRVEPSRPREQEQVLTLQDGVALQRSPPMAVRCLAATEPSRRPLLRIRVPHGQPGIAADPRTRAATEGIERRDGRGKFRGGPTVAQVLPADVRSGETHAFIPDDVPAGRSIARCPNWAGE